MDNIKTILAGLSLTMAVGMPAVASDELTMVVGTYTDQSTSPDFDYSSPILDFSIFRGQNRHFCPRLVSFEHQTKA